MPYADPMQLNTDSIRLTSQTQAFPVTGMARLPWRTGNPGTTAPVGKGARTLVAMQRTVAQEGRRENLVWAALAAAGILGLLLCF